MAKRYFSFEDLKNKVGYFKPANTLGRHHCLVEQINDETILVVGSVNGRVNLKPGDTLGYDIGSVWLLPKPESYRDPIRRVLAQAKISQRVLEYSSEPVRFTESGYYPGWPQNSEADPSTGSEAVVFGEYRKDGQSSSYTENGYANIYDITGGDAIVISSVVDRQELTKYRRRKVTRVIVRPSANRQRVADWLKEVWKV